MVIELNRDDIEKAIINYVNDEILGCRVGKGESNITVTQAKSAKASVKVVKVEVDISE